MKVGLKSENDYKKKIFGQNYWFERHTRHQNYYRDTSIREIKIDAGIYSISEKPL